MKGKKEETNRKQRIMLISLVLIAVLAMAFATWALFLQHGGKQPLAPDYAPKAEENARPIPNDKAESSDIAKGGNSVSLTYSDKATIDLQEEEVTLMFANPGRSNKSVVLQIVVQDKVIVQSGKIEPGKQVTELDLRKDATKLITLGGYRGKFVVYFYDLASEEKAVVNTEIPITITVR